MRIQDLFDENEQPLDHLVDDGGFAAVFRRIGCIGDSLSSGEFEGTDADGNKTYHDMYEHSWGQYLARMCGSTVYNFSRGGMTAKWFMESFARENNCFDPALACEAYIVALGVNDISRVIEGEMVFGELSQVDLAHPERSDTFVGHYISVLQAYRRIRPDSYLFLMTMPRAGVMDATHRAYYDRHRELLFKLSTLLPRTYVIDLRTYAPVYDEEFRARFYLGGHLNPMGYVLTAKMTASYIDYIIRHNMEDFKQSGFVGTPFKNTVDV